MSVDVDAAAIQEEEKETIPLYTKDDVEYTDDAREAAQNLLNYFEILLTMDQEKQAKRT